MWELPNDRADFARQQGAPAGHTEKVGGIPYPRATNSAVRDYPVVLNIDRACAPAPR